MGFRCMQLQTGVEMDINTKNELKEILLDMAIRENPDNYMWSDQHIGEFKCKENNQGL